MTDLKGNNILEKMVYEAERCLFCYDAPCEKGCPINLPISTFIYMIKNKNFYAAYEKVRESHPMINISSFVCPEEILCEANCIRAKIDSPIKIRELHNFLTTYYSEYKNLSLPEYKYEDIAIIGGGPASLSCAFFLRILGYKTHLFVDKEEIGGIPLYEISNYRLQKEVVKKDTDFIKDNFIYKLNFKKIRSIKELENGYKAIFIGIGLGDEIKLDIPGVSKQGVYYARGLLKDLKNDKEISLGNRIGVIGGGNVAFEVANSLKNRFKDKEIFIIYRRGLKDLRCYPEELERAKNLGVNFYFQSLPIEVYGDKKVEGLKVQQVSLKEVEDKNRRDFEIIDKSEFIIPLDNIIIAIGQKIEDGIFPEIEKDNGLIKVNENFMTNINGVFAGGDCVNGGQTITKASSEGKIAAYKIHEYLRRA
ncbi:MAG: FAD-dependent oxidoreductase [Caldisericia bacterium]